MISKTQPPAQGGTGESSTGQQEPEGKEDPAGSAITYGLQTHQLLLPEEDEADGVEFREALWASLAPKNMQEANPAARIITLSWRLQRAGRYEPYVVEAARQGRAKPKKKGRGHPAKSAQVTDGQAIADLLIRTQTYDKMGRHEGRLERWLHQNLTALWALQRARLEQAACQARLLSGQQQSGRAA